MSQTHTLIFDDWLLSVAENPELTLTIERFNFDWRCDGDVVARCHSQSDKSITPARMTERSLSFSLTTRRQNNSGSENLTTQITAQRPDQTFKHDTHHIWRRLTAEHAMKK